MAKQQDNSAPDSNEKRPNPFDTYVPAGGIPAYNYDNYTYQAAPRSPAYYEEQLRAYQAQSAAKTAEIAKLTELVQKSKEVVQQLKEEVERLSIPPNAMGVFERWASYDDDLAYVIIRGDRYQCMFALKADDEDAAATKGDKADLKSGMQVMLNSEMAIIDFEDEETVGEVVTFLSYLEGSRALVSGDGTDSQTVINLAVALVDFHDLKEGDKLLVNRARMAYELLPKTESEDLLLEKVPDISYDQVGGLAHQVQQIKDAVELPIVQHELFTKYALEAPKGVLLYGPPGCGKTLIAKAVANSLAKQMGGGNAWFINIKGPELLTKWVGETERKIREIFDNARRKADEGHIVVVFFDEMESMFRQRGAGVSSDMESTIVPQLLAEIDGVEDMKNVIVIGATNRPDLIDPAVLRPGRLDIKVAVERPDATGARSIFSIYLNDSVPINAEETGVPEMIDAVVDRIYAESRENEFLEVTYEKGDIEKLYFKDFLSGAMIANLVRRAKRIAIKEELATGATGVRLDHLMVAANEEFRENEDLPNTTNPDDWARISGRKGARIANVRSIVQERTRPESKGSETVKNTGQYL